MRRFFFHKKECIYEKMNDAFDKLSYYLEKYRETDYIISDIKIFTKDKNGITLYGFSFKVNNNKPYIYLEIYYMSPVNEILRLSIFDSANDAKRFLSILKVFHIDLNLGILYDPKINKFYLHKKRIRKEKKIFITI